MHISVLVLVIGICLIISGRFLFKQWINPLSLYIAPWTVVLVMFNLKLMAYDDLVTEAWAVIIVSVVAFLSGILVVFPVLMRSVKVPVKNENLSYFGFTDGQFKALIVFFGVLGMIGALQHWMVLIKMFGTIQQVMMAANIIYTMRVEEGFPGVLPYFSFFSYAGSLLVGARIAFRGKLGIIDTLPVLALILKEIANFGRAGLMAGFSELLIGFVICRMMVKYHNVPGHKINFRNFGFAFLVLAILLVSSATTVRYFRRTTEDFKQSSQTLGSMSNNLILTPSIYLYLSGHVGALSKYLYLNNEKALFGENTFLPIYHILTKFHVYNKGGTYQKPYFIPIWINTGTYLREVHADFGPTGVLVIPFLLGFFSTYFWFKVRQSASPYHFVILAQLLIVSVISFLMMFTRDAGFMLSHLVLLMAFAVLHTVPKISKRIKNRTPGYVASN